MRKREMILVTAMMYVLCSGCSKTQQDNTAATITASYDEIMKTENDETKSISESTEEYASQQLQKVQLTLLDAWRTDDPENYFVKYFSTQRKNRGDENLKATATTYVVLMEYQDMDNGWTDDHLPEIELIKADGTEYDWTEQKIQYYGQVYGGQSCIVVCTVDESTLLEKALVQIKDSVLDTVFVNGESAKDSEKNYEYAKTVFYEPDYMRYMKDRWYIMLNDWKSATGSGYHEGKNYSYVDYSTEYAPVSRGLDAVLTADDIDVIIGSQYDTDLYSSQVYVNDSEFCEPKSADYITKIVQHIVLDEDATKQKYGDIDWDQVTDQEALIRKTTLMKCQEQEFWKGTLQE